MLWKFGGVQLRAIKSGGSFCRCCGDVKELGSVVFRIEGGRETLTLCVPCLKDMRNVAEDLCKNKKV